MRNNPYSQIETYRDGDIVARQGDGGREMYIVQTGRIRLTCVNGAGETTQRMLDRGDFFGELSLFQAVPRLETACAVGATKLLVLEAGGFLLKIRRDPTLAFALLQQLSQQVVELEQAARQHETQSTGVPPQAPPALQAIDPAADRASIFTRTNPRARK